MNVVYEASGEGKGGGSTLDIANLTTATAVGASTQPEEKQDARWKNERKKSVSYQGCTSSMQNDSVQDGFKTSNKNQDNEINMKAHETKEQKFGAAPDRTDHSNE